MPDVNVEKLQSLARSRWGMELPAALRAATGINMDMNGIARYMGGQDFNAGGALTDSLEEILSETTVVQGVNGTNASVGSYVSKVFTTETGAITLDAVGGVPRALAPGATNAWSSNMRYGFLHPSISGENFEVVFLCAPQNAGLAITGGTILPQAGVFLRYKEDGVRRQGVACNNNIAYGATQMNYGVWSSALDGTSFLNRQASYAAFSNPPFPYWNKIRLVGNVVESWCWGANEPFPQVGTTNRYRTTNLDTEAGSTAGNLTPTGVGGFALLAAHLGNDARSSILYPHVTVRVLD